MSHQNSPLNPTAASYSRQSDPRFHVPKVDKCTGQPIPQWKQQLLRTKITKKIAERDAVQAKENGICNEVPIWKKEIMAKKEQKLMVSEDPILIRKRRIRTMEQEHNNSDIPPWKRELLKKKIDHVKEEIAQLEEKDQNGKQI